MISEASLERMREGGRRGGKTTSAKRRRGYTPEDDRIHAKRCKNCWLEVATPEGLHHMARGRCNACARYVERTGRERPPAVYLRFQGTTPPEHRRSSI